MHSSYVAGSTQPFIDTASKGAALRAFLPGLPPGDHNIVQHVYINLDIPTAIATLLNPLNSARLHQYCQVRSTGPSSELGRTRARLPVNP